MDKTKLSNKYTLSFDYLEKIYLSSLAAVYGASLPWHAFLVPSIPYNALILCGAFYFATNELVGPINYLHFAIAFSATNYIPTTKSEVIN